MCVYKNEDNLKLSTTNTDSKTNVYKTVPMGRIVVSIRVRREIKEALKQYCLANGLSICHVFEGLVIGFLEGVNQQIEFVNKSPTIDLTVVREVKRLRRYVREPYEEIEEDLLSDVCELCNKPSERLILVLYRNGKRIPTCEACFRDRREKNLVREILGEVKHHG